MTSSNGFFAAHDPEHLFPVTKYSDLGKPEIQKELEKLLELGACIYCGCGQHDHKKRVLYFRRTPLCRRLTLVRKCVEEHDKTCWTNVGTYSEVEQKCQPEMFLAPTGSTPTRDEPDNSGGLNDSTGANVQHLDFSRFCAHVLSTAQIDAFVCANANWGADGFTQPSLSNTLKEIDAQLSAKVFTGNKSAYTAAASLGLTLRFGIIRVNIRHTSIAKGIPLCVNWWHMGGIFSQTVVVPHAVINSAAESIGVFGSEQKAPYICFASLNSEGLVTRLRLFPGYCDGYVFAPSDSASETAYSASLRNRGEVFFKPLLRHDVQSLFDRLGMCTYDFGLHRPDYLVFDSFNNTWSCTITELRGFAPGKIPEYDNNLAAKREFYTALQQSDSRIRFDEITPRNVAPTDMQLFWWDDFELDWWGETEAVKQWRKGL